MRKTRMVKAAAVSLYFVVFNTSFFYQWNSTAFGYSFHFTFDLRFPEHRNKKFKVVPEKSIKLMIEEKFNFVSSQRADFCSPGKL